MDLRELRVAMKIKTLTIDSQSRFDVTLTNIQVMCHLFQDEEVSDEKKAPVVLARCLVLLFDHFGRRYQ